ncbi:IPT/TIG domain-containing protein [Geothrix sp. PMB-07]|uniref:IPT/TIG domain-containing protein n=1 Tax=Geothrix sp. PMB-07 TaxID=3068640 RepID=UPI0027414465|nr:IPT/TIG domain-containing protein [Geothrix sp. PMB-07]WLT32810.1 DUF1501 domain-containing protein [Geothrix sp. PMB-07]
MTTRRTFLQVMASGATAALGLGCSGGGRKGTTAEGGSPGTAPSLDSLSPTHGLPGDSVTLNGTNLAGVTQVLFGTTSAVPGSVAAARLVVTVPAGLATGALSVRAQAAAGASNGLSFTVDAATLPQLTSVVPASAAPGATLQVAGQHLASVTELRFGTVPATPSALTDTGFQVVVPVGLTAGSLSLLAHSAAGDSNALAFQVGSAGGAAVADPILVHLYLDGGNDLLDTLPPLGGAEGAAYLKARPVLHIPATEAFDTGLGFGISDRFLHARQWWQQGRLALLPGIGMDNPDFSHFVSHDLWNWSTAGTPDNTGWMGRWADAAFGAQDVLRGLCVETSLPGLAQGRTRQLVAISSLDGFRWPSMLAPDDAKAFGQATWAAEDRLRSLYQVLLDAGKGDGHASVVGTTGGYSLFYAAQVDFNQRMARFMAPGRTLEPFEKVLYPGDEGYTIDAALPLPADARARIMARFGDDWNHRALMLQLRFIAQMIAADMPTQVYTASLGEFDTHADHKITHEYLMAALGGCLEAFFQQLRQISTAKGAAEDRVIVVVWSEFGRRIEESDSGTDHGAGGLAFAVGKPVKGGAYSAYPSLVKGLADPVLDGNLETTVNFLRLQATLLEKWLPGGSGTSAANLGSSDPKYIQPIPFL